ncbi:MAG: glucosyltransferase domain-containing protein [Clostridiales bacterium]|nr:glucosyltransferase domain-containing protein [Clostridiales bacterium]
MKQAVEEWKRFIKENGKCILLSVVLACVCFGFQAFNGNIRIDTEEFINAPGSTLGWLYIGRYGLVLLKRLLGLTVHQVIKSGVLMLVFFVLGNILLTYGCYHFSGGDSKYPYWLFLLLYATSNIWSFQFYFSLQQAEIALAMLLLIVSAVGMCHICFEKTDWKEKWICSLLGCLLSAVFLVIALASYQALAVFYITLCTVFFILYLLRIAENHQETQQNAWQGVAILVVHFIISYIIYTVIANTWFMAAGDYMESQRNWGTEPVIECMKNILRVVRNQLRTFGPRNFSFYTVGILLALYVIIKIMREKVFRQRKHVVLFLLSMLLLLISPFLMTIYSGAMLVTRTQFALPVVAAFLAMSGVAFLKKYRGGSSAFVKLVKIVGILVICLQIGYNLRLHEADRQRYEHDTTLAEEITTTLEKQSGGTVTELPVLFVGYQKPELNWFGRRSEMYGWSFFEWDYSEDNPTGATHRIDGFMQAYAGIKLNEKYTETMQKEAAELSKNMSTFPAEGSVLWTDEFVVIKLSEIEERTDIDWW